MQQEKKINYSNLDPHVREMLIEVEERSNQAKQLTNLSQLSGVMKLLLDAANQQNQETLDATEHTVQALSAIHDALQKLDKEAPEQPDFAKPVVDALQKLDKSIASAVGKIDVKPEVSVAAPNVQVDAPNVDVDLSGVERVLKTDIPKAFQSAVDSIPTVEVPETDFSPLLEQLVTVTRWLESIDHASRIKPQFPNTIKVTNPDGSYIDSTTTMTNRYDLQNPVYYVGSAPIGATESSSLWTITKYDLTSNPYTGKVAQNAAWSARTGATYV